MTAVPRSMALEGQIRARSIVAGITLRFDEPGTHTFSCSLPGHAAARMTGAVFVQP